MRPRRSRSRSSGRSSRRKPTTENAVATSWRSPRRSTSARATRTSRIRSSATALATSSSCSTGRAISRRSSSSPFIAEWFASLARFSRVLWFDMRGVGMSGSVWTKRSRSRAGWTISSRSWTPPASDVRASSRRARRRRWRSWPRRRIRSGSTRSCSSTGTRGSHAPTTTRPGCRSTCTSRISTRSSGSGERVVHALGLGPSVADRPGVVEWWARVERFGATPRVARARLRDDPRARRARLPPARRGADTRHPQPRQRVRRASGTGATSPSTSPGRATSSATARTTGRFRTPDLVATIEEFVTGSSSGAGDWDRVLATVLFVDVVGSTAFAAELGDRTLAGRPRAIRAGRAHGACRVRRAGSRTRPATASSRPSTGPTRAIRCARRIRDEARLSGLEVRCGLHAGEITRRPAGSPESPCTSARASPRSRSRARCS